MTVNKIKRIAELFLKTAQQRRRVVPNWQKNYVPEKQEIIPDKNVNFLGDFWEPEARAKPGPKQPPQGTEQDFEQEQGQNPVFNLKPEDIPDNHNDNAYESFYWYSKENRQKIENRVKNKVKRDLKNDPDLAKAVSRGDQSSINFIIDEIIADMPVAVERDIVQGFVEDVISPVSRDERQLRQEWVPRQDQEQSYKHNFLGKYDPKNFQSGNLDRPISDVITDKPSGHLFEAFEKTLVPELDRINKGKEADKVKGRADERDLFQKVDTRLQEVQAKISSLMDSLKNMLIIPKLFGKAEIDDRGPKSKFTDRPPSQLAQALRSVQEGGGQGKIVRVMFPKTPHTEAFVSWVLARQDASGAEIKKAFAELQQLHANRLNIEGAKQGRESRKGIFDSMLGEEG